MKKTTKLICLLLFLSIKLLFAGCIKANSSAGYFAIEVVDEQTGRGVPLVELQTVNDIRYYTDSGGVVAFYEPGLMNRDVFFHIQSHGYEINADFFGYRGKTLFTKPGKRTKIQIKRKNIAERLYRVTGQGIYRDSLLTGLAPPISKPVLNGRVLGQDTVMATVYKDKIYWFWGDTDRESYPLGHFATSGATSELPGKGGLDPSVGIDLEYFVDEEGFSKKMVPLPGPGMIWIDGLLTIKDESGRERLMAHYSRMASLANRTEHGLIILNDEKQVFEQLVEFAPDIRLFPGGQVLNVTIDGEQYYYFADLGQGTYPFVRVKANWKHILDPTAYEAFTPLAPGSVYDKDSPVLDRGPNGRVIWAWKKNTAVINADRQRELIEAGKLKTAEEWINLRDVDTGDRIYAKSCAVHWNNFRRRYVMIFQQVDGTSHLGEIWYAEADLPEGPWLYARKILTHDRYTFYNPAYHNFFDEDKGRIIYFEGTYTDSFSGAAFPTPRYNYNQIMYRLDLSDPRLQLPLSP